MMDRRRFAEAADMLNDKYGFERNTEFMGRKEESLRELYHFCREQERRPTPEPAKTLADFREVAARIWCDPAMSSMVMDTNLAESIAVSLLTRIPIRTNILPDQMVQFWLQQAEWSQATFGSDSERGPMGPLKHLAREVLEELLGIDRSKVTEILALAKPPSRDPVEYADLQFLTFDAARRAGLTYEALLSNCWSKLAINKAREWQAPTSDEPVEHVRATSPVAEPAPQTASQCPATDPEASSPAD